MAASPVRAASAASTGIASTLPNSNSIPVTVSRSSSGSVTASVILNTVTNIHNSISSSSLSPGSIGVRKPRKRPQTNPVVYDVSPNTYSGKASDFMCPICFDTIDEPYMTKCGHSFCFKCITRSLEECNRCPKCNSVIERKDQIFPNFLLHEVIQKSKVGSLTSKKKKGELSLANDTREISELLSSDSLDLGEINSLLDSLQKKKEIMEADSRAAQLEILKEFLVQIRRHKKQQLDELYEEVRFVEDDLKKVEHKIDSHNAEHQNIVTMHVVPTTPTGPLPNSSSSGVTCFTLDEASDPDDSCQDGFSTAKHGFRQGWSASSLAARRKRVYQHFADLEACYFNMRKGTVSGDFKSENGLEYVTECLAKFTQFNSCRPLATLNYASDIYNGSSIVSSIEFDRDCDYFAIAGVTKKIKVFEYGQLVRDVVDIHYPVHEMTCNSKISCISWSNYHKGMLASSDYEGTITVWDAFTGSQTQVFQEHEKRCWSVDFNSVDPNLLASGSDDAKVKLWATNMEHSVATLEAKVNVCCVKFNPSSRYNVAFGSADHCVHYYDLRNPKKSLAVLKGHKKAVSYTKFVNANEVVSASTDSQLKLWDVRNSQCLRTYKGHSNEKNFVGLATNGDYIACGSENNSLYVYYKGVSKQLVTFKFDTIRSVLDKDKRDDDSNEFVSAVCWKPDSNVVVAANSQGQIKVLELV